MSSYRRKEEMKRAFRTFTAAVAFCGAVASGQESNTTATVTPYEKYSLAISTVNPATVAFLYSVTATLLTGTPVMVSGIVRRDKNDRPRAGTAGVFNILGTGNVRWIDGDTFDGSMVGRAIALGAKSYVVSAFFTPTFITVGTPIDGAPGTVAYTTPDSTSVLVDLGGAARDIRVTVQDLAVTAVTASESSRP
jgi:hypothetical protein